MKFTSEMLVVYAEKLFAEGAKYWYGTYGQTASSGLYKGKKAQYPSHYTAGRAVAYQKHIAQKRTVTDCVGLIKGFFWSRAGQRAPKYKTNGCPDVSANGMIKLCEETGPIATMPDVPGLLVWNSGHIGVYIGGGKAIEARGFTYGVVKTKVISRSWTRWGRLPASMMQYEDETPEPETPEAPDVPEGDAVAVTSGNTVNVRDAPDTTGTVLGIASKGDVFSYMSETTLDGWHKIRFEGAPGWISGKYTILYAEDEMEPVAPEPERPEEKPTEEMGVILDLSEHNSLKSPKNDWALLADTVDLLILRCGVTRTQTEPLGIGVDNHFKYAARTCIERGIPFGVYYYGKVDTVERARLEARKAFEVASPFGPLFYVYDVEESRLTNAVVEAWMDEIRELGAKKVGLYVAHHMYGRFKKAIAKADFHWEPRYGKNTGVYNPAYAPAHKPDLHQFTSVFSVKAMADKTLDANRLTGKKPLSWFLE
ncbi:MAG: SH3 domain-containing protein [Clostridia bacterium]